MNNLENILEGLLFVAGDSIDRASILEKLQITDKQLEKAIVKLKEKYSNECGIQLITFKDKVQLCSNSKYADDIATVLNPIRERQLSKATLETIAIIAYKQPITRLEVEDIRGVNSDYAIQTLLKHNLIEVVGRKDTIGKPLLFGTTDDFLKRFELNDLSALPDYDELLERIKVIQDESNNLYRDYDVPDDPIVRDENGNAIEVDNNEMGEQINTTEGLQLETQNVIEKETETKLKEIKVEQHQENETNEINESAKLLEEFFEEEIPDFLKDEQDLQKIG